MVVNILYYPVPTIRISLFIAGSCIDILCSCLVFASQLNLKSSSPTKCFTSSYMKSNIYLFLIQCFCIFTLLSFNYMLYATLYGCKFLFVALSKSCTEKTKKKKKPGQQIRKAFTSLHWHENIIFQKWLPLLLISFWRRMFGKLYTFTSFINQQDSPAHFLAILNMLAALTNISAASSTLVELPL